MRSEAGASERGCYKNFFNVGEDSTERTPLRDLIVIFIFVYVQQNNTC